MKTFRWAVIALVLLTTFVDVAMKRIATRLLPSEEFASFPVGLGLHKNPGIAFDIPIPLWIIVPITIVLLLGLGKVVFSNWTTNPKISLAAILVWIGAANNLVDRLINGFTTDYLILFHASAINLADVLIILGAAGLLSYTQHIPSTRTI